MFPYWDEYLEASIRADEPPVTASEYVEEHDRRETTQRGFRAVVTLLADDVFDAVRLPDGPAHLLDVGGGHGDNAIEACRRAPQLRATSLDSPGALSFAEDAAAGLADRVDCRPGDALADDLGTDHDLACCFNAAHGFDPPTNRRPFGRIRVAMTSGGRVVLDQIASDPPARSRPYRLRLRHCTGGDRLRAGDAPGVARRVRLRRRRDHAV
jgi:cyclopropane fatty-acyl-phospholipid synthase-like methyltransferase